MEYQESGKPQAIYPEFPTIETADIYAYVCGDSLRFTAHVTKDSSWLFLPDTALKVIPRRSASGARYASGPYFYWSKGDSALLQIPDDALRSCRTIPQEKSWQAAKIRGADFRAIGQEPGWYLEITEANKSNMWVIMNRTPFLLPSLIPKFIIRKDGRFTELKRMYIT